MEKKTKSRNISLDLIRCIAVLSVISVHFFLNNGYYSEPMLGKRMYMATIIRSAFMICVPSFIMLSGYLMRNKKLSLKYFLGIKKVILIYVISTLFILLYKKLYLHETLTILNGVHNITSFQQYSWYIEMYIGLYCLIPFLNIIYNNLENKNNKRILLCVLFLFTILPSVVNSYSYYIIPDYWTELYPFLYYFLGAYVSEYREEFKLKIRWNVLFFVVAIILSGTYSYYRSYGVAFIWGTWCSWNGLMTFLTSISLFVLLIKLDLKKCPKIIERCLNRISEISLQIYLISWVFDDFVYKFLNNSILNVQDRLYYLIPTVALVFLGSIIGAFIIEWIYKIINVFMFKIIEFAKK